MKKLNYGTVLLYLTLLLIGGFEIKSVKADSGGIWEDANYRQGLGLKLNTATTAVISASTPAVAGLLIYNSTINGLCVSTGTALDAYVLIATGTAGTTPRGCDKNNG